MKRAEPDFIIDDFTQTQRKVYGSINLNFSREIRFTKIIRDNDRLVFYKQLYMLLRSGVNLIDCIELTVEETKNKDKRDIWQGISDNLHSGKSFSDALRCTNVFAQFDITVIEVAEETGRISEVIGYLTGYYESKIKRRRLIIQGLSYPALILCTASLAIFFMLKFIVPVFANIYKRFDAELPYITRFVIYLSGSIQYSWILLIIAVVYFVLSRSFKFKSGELLFRLCMRIPMLRRFILNSYLLQWSYTMTLLISAQLHLVKAVSLSQKVNTNNYFSSQIDKLVADLQSGSGLADALRNSFVPSRFISLLRIGEESNKLPDVFTNIYQQLLEEMESNIKSLSVFLEPVLILFIGIWVGIILISMYLPMFKLGGVLHG